MSISEKSNSKAGKESTSPELSRREFVTGAAAAAAGGLVSRQGQSSSSIVRTDLSTLPPYGNGTIPAGIRSRAIPNVNGLSVHILEAGFEKAGQPAILL